MRNLKSHLRFDKRQRNAILALLTTIILVQISYFFIDFSSDDTSFNNQVEVNYFQHKIDSLKTIELENRKPKVFPFNPNYITDFKGYQLGMNPKEIDKLHQFRKQNKFVNSAKDFQKITGVSDSLLNKISPLFKFPDWVTQKKHQRKFIKSKATNIKIVSKDINEVTKEDLIKINGIGEKLATRILSYRKKLGGYLINDQLYEVWYLDKEVANRVLQYYNVINKPTIQKINVNTASFKEVLSIVYIDYELTKKIFNYRDEVAELQSLEELKKIEGFPLQKFDRIALYLEAK